MDVLYRHEVLGRVCAKGFVHTETNVVSLWRRKRRHFGLFCTNISVFSLGTFLKMCSEEFYFSFYFSVS